ncbi:MAG: nucleotide exchange factor GrpE [Actinomycetota bacterium]|nr:nucleotide exchange factor GrpE [Actinomycetota bacterium]
MSERVEDPQPMEEVAPVEPERPEVLPPADAEDAPAVAASTTTEPAPDTAGPDLGAAVAALHEDLRALAVEVERLAASNTKQADTMARKVEVVQKLHDENQRLRRGELEQAQMPLLTHLIELVDQIGRSRETLGEEAARELAFVDAGLAEGLRRAGIERIVPEAGEPFDPERHQAVGRREVTEPALDETVDEIRNALFVRGDGRVVRAAHVFVNVMTTGPDDASSPDPDEEHSE